VITAYVTATESDTYLAAYPDWLALDEAAKDDHLSWGRIWIDSLYTCPFYDDDSNLPPDEVQHANSLAGYANFNGTLYADSQTVKSTTVTAGSVASSKTYMGGYTQADPMLMQADALVTYYCPLTITASGVANLTRD